MRDQVGERGAATVYRAFQPAVGREVAIKVTPPALANEPDFIRRFQADAQSVARLQHPHIVPLYDYTARRLVAGEWRMARHAG